MLLKLQVTKVMPGSYEKNGQKYETLDLVCMDLGEGRRLSHSVLFAPDRTQRPVVEEGLDLRDKVITCDVETVMTNFSGAVVFRGFIALARQFRPCLRPSVRNDGMPPSKPWSSTPIR